MTRRGNPTVQFHIAWEEAMRLNQTVQLACQFCTFTASGCFYLTRREHRKVEQARAALSAREEGA